MNFITIKEASVLWNIDVSRIGKLMRAGKIPGATKIGGHWVIPEGTPKPLDGRTKNAKADIQLQVDNFRYPSFEYRDISSFNPPLCKEELIMKSAVEAFYACRFNEASNILDDLPETTTDRYRRIATLYVGCMIDMSLCNIGRFFDRYGRLLEELLEDFPYKNEMKEYIHELDAILGEDKYFSNEFTVDCTYSYHESFLPHLATLCAIPLFSPSTNPTATEIKNAELNCIFLKSSDAYADLQSIHVYLGNTYSALDNLKAANFHFTKALEIAEEHDIFFPIAVQYAYIRKTISRVLPSFSSKLKVKLERYSNEIHMRYLKFSHEANHASIYELLTCDEYIYLQYAVQGFTNREVAERMHISVGTVGKHYGEIYSMLGVKNKKELTELYYSLSDKTIDKESGKRFNFQLKNR